MIASILLAHIPENPIENEMLTYLKTLKTSNHLFALAYYSQKQKKPIEFTDDEKLKIMKMNNLWNLFQEVTKKQNQL